MNVVGTKIWTKATTLTNKSATRILLQDDHRATTSNGASKQAGYSNFSQVKVSLDRRTKVLSYHLKPFS